MAEVTYYLRRPAVRWDLAYPEAFADRNNPTAEELNNSTLVKNITCAIDEESTTFNLGDSETDDRYSYCDDSGQTRPTSYNPEAALGIFRDTDRNAAGEFNLALEHFMFPDIPYILIKRVGPQSKNSDSPYTEGDRLKMMYVRTDLPVDELGGDDPALMTQSFTPAGWLNWNHEVGA